MIGAEGVEAIRARVEAATPGPWAAREGDLEGKPASEYARTLFANRENDGTTVGRLFLTMAPNPIDPELGDWVVPALTGDGPQAEANAEFIAAARTDVPVLLAELDRLTTALAAAERLVARAERAEAEWDARRDRIERIKDGMAARDPRRCCASIPTDCAEVTRLREAPEKAEAEVESLRAQVAAAEALAATWESDAIDGEDLYCAAELRAALADPDAGDQR